MEPTKSLYMMVGLPQSGKSTIARKMGYPVVNPDSIRLALHGEQFIGQMEPYVWAIARTMVEALFLAGHDAVVLDATNVTRARRDAWKSGKWERIAVEMDEAEGVCQQRAAAREDLNEEDRKGLSEAIERMSEQYEPILDEEDIEQFVPQEFHPPEPEQNWWFTLGQNHIHVIDGVKVDRDTVLQIKGTFGGARDKMFDLCGRKWSTQYEADRKHLNLDLFPNGIHIVE